MAISALSCASAPPIQPGMALELGLGTEPELLCTLDGVAVRAFRVGADHPRRLYVFIHGWAGNGAEFLDVARELYALDPDSGAWCVDLPGTGSSDKPADAPYDHAWFGQVIRACLAAAVDKAGADGQEPVVTLVGHSLGGHMAYRYAATDGALLDRLCLLAPAGLPGETGAFGKLASRSPFAIGMALSFLTEASYLRAHRARVIYDKDKFPEASARYGGRSLATKEGKAALKAVTLRALEHDTIEDAAGSLDLPVLLVWGHNDKVLPFRYASEFRAILPPGHSFLEFERCGHCPHSEYPAELAASLDALARAP